MLRALQLELKMNAPHQLVILVVSVLLAALTFAFSGSLESAMGFALISTTSNLYISQIETEELPGWEAFRATWPLTRQQMVIARYLELLSIVVTTLVASMVGCLAIQAMAHTTPIAPLNIELPYDLGLDVSPSILVFNAAILCTLEMAILLPVVFRSASSVAPWIISIASMALSIFLIGLIGYLSEMYVEVFGPAYWVISTGTVAAIALTVSAIISIHLYSRRDL